MPTFLNRAGPLFWISLLLPLVACSVDDDAKQANCDALVTETRAACLDMISRGLDVSCNTYLGAVGTAMKQADGSLFDAGDANESTADSFCSTYVDKLREDRDEHADSMHGQDQAGPKCTALANRFETQCLADLGKEPLPGKCKRVGSSYLSITASQLSPGKLCSVAGMQLPKE